MLLSVVQDATPKLGGDLDVNGKTITSSSNGHIVLDPTGNGKVGINTTSPAATVHLTAASGAVDFTIDGKGAASADCAHLNMLTKGDGTKVFGDANTKVWQFKGHSDTFSTTSYRNELGLYAWDGTILRIVMWWDKGGWVGVQTLAPSSRFAVNGPISTAVATKTADYTLGTGDSVVLADATSAQVTLTLPTAVGPNGRQCYIKRLNGGSNNVVVAAASGQTIDGAASKTLSTQYASITIVSDNAHWWILD